MNYWEYIRVEELLRLQGGIDGEESALTNDEVVFIVSHQVYELWFKLIIRELVSARALFHQNPVPDMAMASAVRSFKRVTTLFEQAASHFRVLETLTTRDYLAFRDSLIPMSGFQSAQMREIEILLGLEDATRIKLGTDASYKEALKSDDGSPSPALARVEARLHGGPTLREVVYAWLARTPVSPDGPDGFLNDIFGALKKESDKRLTMQIERMQPSAEELEVLQSRFKNELEFARTFLLGDDDTNATPEARSQRRHVRAALVFLESHRELPRLAWPREVVDAIIEMEQAIVVWRQRHARMVERVIGRRVGTGGSSGVDYLDQTALRYRIFADLWAVRTLLLRKAAIPPIDNADEFRFRVED